MKSPADMNADELRFELEHAESIIRVLRAPHSPAIEHATPTPLRGDDGAPDAGNYMGVALSSDGVIAIAVPSRQHINHADTTLRRSIGPLTHADALRLVAWVSVIAEITDGELLAARRQVEST